MKNWSKVEEDVAKMKERHPDRALGFGAEISHRPEIAHSISVAGDALIASEINIETVQTRVINPAPAAAISETEAAMLVQRAEEIVSLESAIGAEVTTETVLAWLSDKMGVTGYRNIPAVQVPQASSYLETRSVEAVRRTINQGVR